MFGFGTFWCVSDCGRQVESELIDSCVIWVKWWPAHSVGLGWGLRISIARNPLRDANAPLEFRIIALDAWKIILVPYIFFLVMITVLYISLLSGLTVWSWVFDIPEIGFATWSLSYNPSMWLKKKVYFLTCQVFCRCLFDYTCSNLVKIFFILRMKWCLRIPSE